MEVEEIAIGQMENMGQIIQEAEEVEVEIVLVISLVIHQVVISRKKVTVVMVVMEL
jgi:hypothetical protein